MLTACRAVYRELVAGDGMEKYDLFYFSSSSYHRSNSAVRGRIDGGLGCRYNSNNQSPAEDCRPSTILKGDEVQEQTSATGNFENGDHLSEAVDKFLTPHPSPPKARDQEIQSRGTKLKLDRGLAAMYWGNGPIVLLAHGWNSRGTHWGAFITALVDAGFRAVAVDAPAHGDSPGRRANVFEYGVGLLRMSRQFGPMAGVIGHSFGAGAAVIAVHKGLDVKRVVLLSGPASLRAVVERWGRRHRLPETDIPTFVRMVECEVGEPIDGLDIVQIAARLTHPVLVVHDRGDDSIPVEDGMAVAAAWPGAKTLITERYGHGRILIAKEVVREVVDFLKAAIG
jgi:pimeloyl-ACP methyl ester carboxylesterase